ncbi:MAG: hypothetical protein LQ341_001118 [Variospora aurantia]|nr:MAG: hypothetical protein LQ341_001118 [Variospora aurantia]
MVATRSQDHNDHAFPPIEDITLPEATAADLSAGKRKKGCQPTIDAGSPSGTKRQKINKTGSNLGDTSRTLAAVVIPTVTRDATIHQVGREETDEGAQYIAPALENPPSERLEERFSGKEQRGRDDVNAVSQREYQETRPQTPADREEPSSNKQPALASITKATVSPNIKTKKPRKRYPRMDVTTLVNASPRPPTIESEIQPEARHKVTSLINTSPHAPSNKSEGWSESRHKRFGNEEATFRPHVPFRDLYTGRRKTNGKVGESTENMPSKDPPPEKSATEGKVEDSEAESSSDEAPEVVTKTTGLEKTRTAAAVAAKAAEAQRAAGKQRRRERDTLLKLQAKTTKKDPIPTTGVMEASSSPSPPGFPNEAKWSSRDALPALLPDEILAAEPIKLFPTPPPEPVLAKAPINKRQRFLEESSKTPKDIKKGNVRIRILEEQKVILPPKVSKRSQSIRESWLVGRQGVKGIATVERRKMGSGFVRR